MPTVEEHRTLSETLKGKRIKCISMNEEEEPIESGELGTIDLVDDMGTIHVDWDNGRRLGIVPEEDKYELV